MADPISLPSGKLLVLNAASFEEANALKKVVLRELTQVRSDLSNIDVDVVTAADVSSLKDVVFQVLGSEAVDAALHRCMARCIYDQQPATIAAFQPESAREDYQYVAGEVLLYNLTPFFKGLLSLLKTKVPAKQSDRGSE